MQEKCQIVKLENDKEYIILDEIDNYVYLSCVLDEKNFCIRKSIKKDDGEYFTSLDDEEEFKKALLLFEKKNK